MDETLESKQGWPEEPFSTVSRRGSYDLLEAVSQEELASYREMALHLGGTPCGPSIRSKSGDTWLQVVYWLSEDELAEKERSVAEKIVAEQLRLAAQQGKKHTRATGRLITREELQDQTDEKLADKLRQRRNYYKHKSCWSFVASVEFKERDTMRHVPTVADVARAFQIQRGNINVSSLQERVTKRDPGATAIIRLTCGHVLSRPATRFNKNQRKVKCAECAKEMLERACKRAGVVLDIYKEGGGDVSKINTKIGRFIKPVEREVDGPVMVNNKPYKRGEDGVLRPWESESIKEQGVQEVAQESKVQTQPEVKQPVLVTQRKAVAAVTTAVTAAAEPGFFLPDALQIDGGVTEEDVEAMRVLTEARDRERAERQAQVEIVEEPDAEWYGNPWSEE